MLASITLALTPTFLCAMTAMALLVILDTKPTLGQKRSTRAIFLFILTISFALLCAILLQLPIHPLVKVTLATAAMFFSLPATLKIAMRAREEPHDSSPLLWRWRSRPGWGGTRQHLMNLGLLEEKLRLQPLDAILNLKAMELALAAHANSRALYHARLLDEILPEGSAHAHVLWVTSEILVHRQRRPADAISVLRRLEKLYPTHEKSLRQDPWPSQSKPPSHREDL